MKAKTQCGAVVLCVLALGMASVALGEGFRNPPDGAVALGRIGGRIAQIDDATAVSHNPANLTAIDEPVVLGSVTVGYAEKEFTSAMLGATYQTEDPWRYLPSVYAAWPVGENKCVVGVGVNVPFGQSTRWEKTIPAPYFSEMITVNVNPTVAFKLGKSVSFGAGLDVYRSQLDIDQMIPGASPMEPPAGSSSFEGDGYAVGCNFGLTWQMAKQHRLAVTYRSPFDVDYEGDTEVTSLTPGFGVPPSDFKTTMNFPAIVGIGYGVELTDTVRVEINAEWLEHSRLENINLDAGSNNGLLLAAMGTTTLPQNWQDGWTFGAGGDWRFAPNWMLRAGFLYMETPVPVQTLMPSVAEEDNEVLSLGVGYRKGAHALDAAYAVGLFDGRDVAGNQNPMFDGNYDFESHLMALSYSYSF